MLIFASGGHHAAYLLPADTTAWPALPLVTPNPIVGMLPDPRIVAADVEVPAGSTLHLFSDGVFEVVDREGRQLGLDDIVAMLADVTRPAILPPAIPRPAIPQPAIPRPATGAHAAAPDDPKRLYDRIRAIARPGPLDDDFSALVFRFP